MRIPKLPALIVGIVFAVVLFGAGFAMLGHLPGRASDDQPRDVIISEVTSSSAKINYSTGNKTQGVVEYGLSPTTLNLLAPESETKTEHEVELTLLSEDTTYYFQISIGGKKFDNAGVPWTFSTKSASSSSSSSTERISTASPSLRPSPVAKRAVISDEASTCTETTCEKIKLKLGKGCTTQDYIRCLKKSPTP